MKKIILVVWLVIVAVVGIEAQNFNDPDFKQKMDEENVTYLDLAQFFNYQGDYQQGLACALEAIKQDPKSAQAYFQAGLAYYGEQEWTQSRNMFEKALKYGKKDKALVSSASLLLSNMAFLSGDTVRAIKFLDNGLKSDKDNISLLTARARLYINSDRKKAEKDIADIQKLSQDALVYYNIATIYGDIGEFTEALNFMNQAIALDDTMTSLYDYRGRLYYGIGKKQDAFADLVKILAMDPESDMLETFSLIDTPEERDMIIKEMERQRRDAPELGIQESYLLADWGRRDDAEQVIREMIKTDAGGSYPILMLASLYAGQNDIVGAYNILVENMGKYPDDISLMQYKAQLATQLALTDEAISLYNILITRDPRNETLYGDRGNVFLMAGQYDNAISDLSGYIAAGGNPKAHMALMFAYYLKGDMENARKLAQILIQNVDAWEEELNPPYVKGIANAVLGNKTEAMKMIDIGNEGNSDLSVLEEIAIGELLGGQDRRDAVNKLRMQFIGVPYVPIVDLLYTYIFYPMHGEEEFGELIENLGYNIPKDPATGLYRIENLARIYAPDVTAEEVDEILGYKRQINEVFDMDALVDDELLESEVITQIAIVPQPPPPPPLMVDDDWIYNVVAVPPKFSGDLNRWLSMNIRYPEEAQREGISGRVILQFVVERDGSVTNVKVVKGVRPVLDNEALRVVGSMPDWIPGSNEDGIPVRCKFTLPINFSLPEKSESAE